MDVLKASLEMCILFPAAVLCYLPMEREITVDKRKLAIILSIVFFVNAWASGFLLARWQLPSNFILLPEVIVFFLIYKRTVDVGLCKKFFVYLSTGTIVSSVTAVVNVIDIALYPEKARELWFEPFSTALQIIICFLIAIVIWKLARKKMDWMMEYEEDPKMWGFACMAPLACLLINIYLVPLDPDVLMWGRMKQIYVILSIALMSVVIAFYCLFYKILYAAYEKSRLEEKNHYLTLQSAQYHILQERMEETRRARHDLRHNILMVDQLIAKEAWEELKQFQKKRRDTIEREAPHFCDILEIDSLLSYYWEQAVNAGISFKAEIKLWKSFPAEIIDLCIALSNLLENALEACARNKEPGYIEVKLKQQGKTVFFLVENSFDGKVKKKNSLFLSLKRENSPGMGLQSVEKTAKMLGGDMQIYNDEAKFRVFVTFKITSK
ncbi:MAG: ATP-binding protein [Lachnospiraceae bacterium]|nr:ATP-binding protein [Lachnospiraceae bacterium]